MSFNLSIDADVKKYLALRKQQIEAQTRMRQKRDPETQEWVDVPITGQVVDQSQLACGCIVQNWINEWGSRICERDWCANIGAHTDGANDPET